MKFSSESPFFSVHQIEKRHILLQTIIGVVKPEETKSYEYAIFYRAALTSAICSLVILEGAAYFIYLLLVFKSTYQLFFA